MGEQTAVKARGLESILPAALTVDGRDKGPGTVSLVRAQRRPRFEQRALRLDVLPECLEKEPNNTPAEAQRITLPIIINGRVDRPGDWDVFRFEGRAGQQIVAEVYARRLDSPLDSVLWLTDAAGKQLAFNDDYEDKGSGLNTHHADSLLTATLPADGSYFIHLGDAQHQGGPAFGYRLRISEPRPDFELRVVPSSINVRARHVRAHHRLCLAQGRLLAGDRVGLEGCPGGICAQRGQGARQPGSGAADADGSSGRRPTSR